MATPNWAVESYQLNVDSGDSSVHFLMQPGDARSVEKSILMDGGTGQKGSEALGQFMQWVDTSMLFHRADGEASFSVDSIVATHWDADHIDGIATFLSKDLQEKIDVNNYADVAALQAAIRLGTLRSSHTHYRKISDQSDIRRPVSLFFAPYLLAANSTTIGGKYNTQPTNQIKDPLCTVTLENKEYLAVRVYLDKPLGFVAEVPVALLRVGPANLGVDCFTGTAVVIPDQCTSPKIASAQLCKRIDLPINGNIPAAPAMLCVVNDSRILDNNNVPARSGMVWTLGADNQSYNMPYVKLRPAPGLTANSGPAWTFSDNVSTRLIDGDTTPNNDASMGCMLIWPNQDTAQISGYYCGDLGEKNEDKLLRWSLIPDNPAQPNGARSSFGLRIHAMKLCHHGICSFWRLACDSILS